MMLTGWIGVAGGRFNIRRRLYVKTLARAGPSAIEPWLPITAQAAAANSVGIGDGFPVGETR